VLALLAAGCLRSVLKAKKPVSEPASLATVVLLLYFFLHLAQMKLLAPRFASSGVDFKRQLRPEKIIMITCNLK
jgi:hypothetical protein